MNSVMILKEINDILQKYFGEISLPNNLSNPLDVLIATILSQNTNDNNSYKAFIKLKEAFPGYVEIVNTDFNEFVEIIKVAGLKNQKGNAIVNFLRYYFDNEPQLFEKLSLMQTIEAVKLLSNFEGIGVKTAACVLLFGFGRNICPVDTHVNRVLNRLGIIKANSIPEKTFYCLNSVLPEGIGYSLHSNLIKLGRNNCRPKRIYCADCPLISICNYSLKSNERLPENFGRNEFLLLDNIS